MKIKKPDNGKEKHQSRKRQRRVTEKTKTGAEHKTGELGELDGAELGRLSNEVWERQRTGGLDSTDERDL
jgi:hypothetical protein